MYKNISFVSSTQVFIKFYGTYLNHMRIWILNFLLKRMQQYFKCSCFNIGLFAEPENTVPQCRNIKGRNHRNLLQFPHSGTEEKMSLNT